MIFVKNTPNNTGVAIHGDHMDFENLYDALHTVTGNEDEFVAYEAARIRVLGVCYDIRHALMGDREIEFVDNGMDVEKKRRIMIGICFSHTHNSTLTLVASTTSIQP